MDIEFQGEEKKKRARNAASARVERARRKGITTETRRSFSSARIDVRQSNQREAKLVCSAREGTHDYNILQYAILQH